MEEESLKCPNCGKSEFTESSMYNVVESVYLTRENDKIMVVALSINNIDQEQIESLNEFVCKSCGSKCSIVKYEGKENLAILE